jgi:hypothetical protein
VKSTRVALLGVVLLVGAAPAGAQQCRLDLAAGPGTRPGVSVCSEMVSTSSTVSLWDLPGLASQPSVYDAFLDAIGLIPERDGLSGWATAETMARLVTPSLGPVSLVAELGVEGMGRLDLPAPSLDYFRSDTLADSLYWSFDGVNGLGVAFRSVAGGVLVELAEGVSVGAAVRFLDAERLAGGRVTGGMVESFRGLEVDLEVAELRNVHGSGTAFDFLARLERERFRAGISLDRVGAPVRLTVENRVRAADAVYQSTEDAVEALGPTRTVDETVEVELPTRLALTAGHEIGARTWLWVDSDVWLDDGFDGANRVGARLLTRPTSWIRLEAGGGWSSGPDATLGLGLSAGRLTWTLHGRSALDGRDVRLATGIAIR